MSTVEYVLSDGYSTAIVLNVVLLDVVRFLFVCSLQYSVLSIVCALYEAWYCVMIELNCMELVSKVGRVASENVVVELLKT